MESGDGAILDEIENTIQQECDRFVAYGSRFIERYEHGTLCFHLHLGIKVLGERFRELEAGDWCFVVSHPNARLGVPIASIRERQAEARVQEFGGNDVQEPMLISIREAPEKEEGMGRRIVPSLVRLQSLNDCQYVRSDAANDLRLDRFARLVFGLGAEDRELRSVSHRSVVRLHQAAG